MENENQKIGNRIRECRKNKGLTIKQLADLLSISEQAVSQYELGKRQPKIELLREIADAIGVSIDYLLGGIDSRQLSITEHFPDGRMPRKFSMFDYLADKSDGSANAHPNTIRDFLTPPPFKQIEEMYFYRLMEEKGTNIENLVLTEDDKEQLRNTLYAMILGLGSTKG